MKTQFQNLGLWCCTLAVGLFWSGDVQADGDLTESQRLNEFFETSFQGRVERSPVFQAQLGIKKDYDLWDDFSDAAAIRDLAIVTRELAELKTDFDFEKLDRQSKLSYRLFEHEAELAIANYQWRYHDYPFNQMFGVQSMLPAFLINYHRVTNETDAGAYISRLHGVQELVGDIIEGVFKRRDRGILPPKFVFDLVLGDARNLLKGEPFDESGVPSTLLSDFTKKIEAMEGVDWGKRVALVAEAKHALIKSVKPAYENIVSSLEKLKIEATHESGVWKLPKGGDFYNHQLRSITTTELTADEIYELGLSEMNRIHDEMRKIMSAVSFKGNLQDFFGFMKNDPQFYYPETEKGREAYLAEATAIVDRFRGDLDRMFITKPKAEMEVKRVESFREKSAGKAFYNPGTPDGSKPGTYYANLYRMDEMPIYQMEALAFHEGIPGHHMQISIAQELEGIPTFRKYGRYTAYIEGWGLYCELLPKEYGYYQDPYSDFGRLAMELWRAARLVVDTGLHVHKWSREKAIEYLVENTPNPKGDCVKAIERYIVMPGQATAYKIGMLKILELREKSKRRLGDAFDIRKFHDVILANGPVPLSILEELVDEWVAIELKP